MQAITNGMRPIHPGEVLREEFLQPMGITAHALAIAPQVPDALAAREQGHEGPERVAVARLDAAEPTHDPGVPCEGSNKASRRSRCAFRRGSSG